MPRKPKKPWNADLGPADFPSLHGLPAHEPKPMTDAVAPLPSTGVVMSPRMAKTIAGTAPEAQRLAVATGFTPDECGRVWAMVGSEATAKRVLDGLAEHGLAPSSDVLELLRRSLPAPVSMGEVIAQLAQRSGR